MISHPNFPLDHPYELPFNKFPSLGEYTGLLARDRVEFDAYAVAYPLVDVATGASWYLVAYSFDHMENFTLIDYV